MNNRPECIPCCLRRVLKAADQKTSDEWLHRKILGEVMQDLSRVDEVATPAELVHGVAKKTARALGVVDPYAEERKRWLDEITGNAEWIRSEVATKPDPFVAALRLSIVANIFDNELRADIVDGFSLKSLVRGFENVPFVEDSVEDFRLAAQKATSVLFVHDSAAELFFDRLLIEALEKPREAVASVVRETTILADATLADAEAVGLGEVAEILDIGIDGLGVPLNACSQAFRERYEAADMVIAKGQAAFETLAGDDLRKEGVEKEIFYLLRVKCAVIARELGAGVGEAVLELG